MPKRDGYNKECIHTLRLVIIDASMDYTIAQNGTIHATNADGTENHMQNRHFSVSLAAKSKSIEMNASGKIIVCCSVDTICNNVACDMRSGGTTEMEREKVEERERVP